MTIKVGMVSLGCPKNQVDGEMLLARLAAAGYEITADAAAAQVILVNTCGFIEAAKQEAIDTILEMAQLKQTARLKALVVTGCLAERYREQLREQMPEIDAVVGIGKNGDIVSVVNRALAGHPCECYGAKTDLPLSGERVLAGAPHSAYLKIAEGCSNRCAYCAIPAIRGPLRSRSMESVVEEAQTLAARGVKELIVVAQDTTRYGEDLTGKCMLPELLTRLCKVEGIHWIRLLYAYPDRVTPELLAVMAREEKIVKYIDLPIQHCCGSVLRRMNRPGDRQSLTACIAAIRQAVPNIVIRTTVMVGFPGETEEEFNELCAFLKEMRFPRLGCFAFSEEEDTPAAVMDGAIDPALREHRRDILMQQQTFLMEEIARSQVGKRMEVLAEGFDEARGLYIGRSTADAPEIDGTVYFQAAGVTAGQFVTVTVTDTDHLDLIGKEQHS